MRFKGLLLIILLQLAAFSLHAQSKQISYSLHSRVDTSKKEVKQIVSLWIDYLSSKPDSIRPNIFWSESEQKRFRNYDLSTKYLYQFPSSKLLNYYKPQVLSVEKEGSRYCIRTMFYAEGLEGNYKRSNPWSITKVYAELENGKWRLRNTIFIETETWTKKKVGKITFIYPPSYSFNLTNAEKANKFCEEKSTKYELGKWEEFDYYITQSGDELGKLLNFDFFFAGYTTGVGLQEERILISGFGSEYYPHEFIHMLTKNNSKRHPMVNEGLATWLGGSMNRSFEESAKILFNQLEKTDTLGIEDILQYKWGWQYNAFYTTGAVICKMVYDRSGNKGLQELLGTGKSDEELLLVLEKQLNVTRNELMAEVRRSLKQIATPR